jgi:hypothetical protein
MMPFLVCTIDLYRPGFPEIAMILDKSMVFRFCAKIEF